MICAFSSCHHKTSESSDSDQSLLSVSECESESEGSKKNESDNKSMRNKAKSDRRKKGDGKDKEITSAKSMSNPAELTNLLDARQRTLNVQSEKRNVIARALQAQWWLIQKRLESQGGGDSLYDNAYLMLEPEFQPITPATDIPESMRIFEDHKKLAKDYLQTRTEIECLLQAKKDLEQQLREQDKYGPFGGQRDSQRILKEWRELKSENESLVQYHCNLKKQLEIIKSKKPGGNSMQGTQEFEPEPGWVYVSRRDHAPDGHE